MGTLPDAVCAEFCHGADEAHAARGVLVQPGCAHALDGFGGVLVAWVRRERAFGGEGKELDGLDITKW